MTRNDGGPAFPTPRYERGDAYSLGMSLRDWFAGQILIGLSIKREGKSDADDAINAYRLADEMLRVRDAS